jgi:RNA polymerase sigma-B factor
MRTDSRLRDELPRDVRRQETTRLLDEAAAATPGAERDGLIEEVVLANVGVARTMAHRYAGRGVPVEDLEQVAYLALVRAAHKFDPERAEDFLVFAVPTIRGELKRWFRDRAWTVRPPRSIQELQLAILKYLGSAETATEQEPATIAQALGVTPKEVTEAMSARGCFTPSSLDAPTSGDDGSTPLGNLLPDYDDAFATIEVRLALEQALSNLTPRERLIVRLRFNEDMTQAEIGEIIGVTQMQVSRILQKVLVKLREVLADDPMSRGETWGL